MTVKLVWATPNGDDLLAYMARVSNPEAELGENSERLLRYLIKHHHWSPFEMVHACVEINCPRDISRQILRHRSFSFQEFSGRYAKYATLLGYRAVRLQHPTNRQMSVDTEDPRIHEKWQSLVDIVRGVCFWAYDTAISLGVAKEQARALLPEGLVPTKMYMVGSMRSWIHYWQVRCTPETQKEHRDVAEQTRSIIMRSYPKLAEILK